MMFDLSYILNQESIKSRKIASILKWQKNLFCNMLEKESKSIWDDLVDDFIDETKDEIPNYLVDALPTVMNRWMQGTKKEFKKELPNDYSLWFNLETSPASNYLRNLEELHLSQRDWSISKTTNDELKKLIADWIDEWYSYGKIAKQIRETDPFVFSKTRAKLIAVQEVWQAYWFWNWQPIEDMMADGLKFEKLWVTSHDAKVRPTHKDNENQWWIDATKEWLATGDMFAPSHDFRCRCYQKNRVV